MFWLEWIVTPIMLFTMGKLRYVSAQHSIASHDTPLLYHCYHHYNMYDISFNYTLYISLHHSIDYCIVIIIIFA
jgi:hypothetical protein